MKNRLLLVFACLLPLLSFAQSNLTIFSEDGDRFFLVLNGIRQNEMPQTNLRVEGLVQPFYKATIIFEDKTKGEISKSLPVVDQSTNAFADVTYKIKKGKDGDMKMRYFSATPIQQNYAAPGDVYVTQYDAAKPNVIAADENNSKVSSSTSMSINLTYDPMQPQAAERTTQTTTTRTTTTRTTTTNGYDEQNYTAKGGCQYPMGYSDFNNAKVSVNEASFDDTKISTAKSIIDGNCLSAEQVVQLCKLLSYESSKLEIAKYAYARVVDPGNYFKVNSAFDFDASKTELNNYVGSHRR